MVSIDIKDSFEGLTKFYLDLTIIMTLLTTNKIFDKKCAIILDLAVYHRMHKFNLLLSIVEVAR